MKKPKILSNSFVSVFMLLATLSCTKDEFEVPLEGTVQVVVLKDEAADAVIDALTQHTGGLSDIMEEIIRSFVIEFLSGTFCAETTTIELGDKLVEETFTSEYSGEITYEVSCLIGVPFEAKIDVETASLYSSAQLSINGNSKLAGEVKANLDPLGAIMGGSYVLENNLISNTAEEGSKNYESRLELNLQELEIDALGLKISSGFGTLLFTGVTQTDNEFSYEGNITFNGDRTVTLQFEDLEFLLDFRPANQNL